MPSRAISFWMGFVILTIAPLVLSGCGKKEQEEDWAKQLLPDSLSFTQKVERASAHTFQRLQQFAQNHPGDEYYAGISLHTYVPGEKLFSMLEGKGFTYHNLYYGVGAFSGIYPVDPTLPIDSTVALLNLEARGLLAERIRIGEESVSNITDELQRKVAEEELAGLRDAFGQIDSGGMLFYGAEVNGLPGPLLSLLGHPDRLVRVVFPNVPAEGSWVRLSPYQFERFLEKDRQTALQ